MVEEGLYGDGKDCKLLSGLSECSKCRNKRLQRTCDPYSAATGRGNDYPADRPDYRAGGNNDKIPCGGELPETECKRKNGCRAESQKSENNMR